MNPVLYISFISCMIHLSSPQARDISNSQTLTKQINKQNNLPPAEASNQLNHWVKTDSLGENIKYKSLAPISHKLFPIRTRRGLLTYNKPTIEPFRPFNRYKYDYSVVKTAMINKFATTLGNKVYNWIINKNWTLFFSPTSDDNKNLQN